MDKEEAVRVLAVDLVNMGLINHVREDVIKQHILQTTSWVNLTETKSADYNFQWEVFRYLLDDKVKSLGANYCFYSPFGGTYSVTLLAVAGKKEFAHLRKHYQENMPEKIIEAGDMLGADFSAIVNVLKLYSQASLDKLRLGDEEGELRLSLFQLLFNEIDTSKRNPKADRQILENIANCFCDKKLPSQFKPELMRGILKLYTEGHAESFKEILDALAKNKKGYACWREFYPQLFNKIGHVNKRNISLDIWLHKQHKFELKDINMVELYGKDSELFKQGFEALKEEEKKEALDLLFSLKGDQVNKDLDQWLSATYPEIVTIAGRDRYILRGE